MENYTFTGKVTFVSEIENGISKAGKDYSKMYFIVEDENEYPNSMKFELFNKPLDIIMGSNVTVEYNARVNEYQSKHYQGLSAWKVTNNSVVVKEQKSTEIPKKTEYDEINNDLPF